MIKRLCVTDRLKVPMPESVQVAFHQANGFGHSMQIAFSGDVKMVLDVVHTSIIVGGGTGNQRNLYSVLLHNLFRSPGSNEVRCSNKKGADMLLDLWVADDLAYVIFTKNTIAKFSNDHVGLALIKLV